MKEVNAGILSVAENGYSNMISRTDEITTGLVQAHTEPVVRWTLIRTLLTT